MRKLKRGTKYVVRCVKDVRRADVLMGNHGWIRKGDLVSTNGAPVQDPNEAAIYVAGGEDFPFDDMPELTAGAPRFEAVPVIIRLIK